MAFIDRIAECNNFSPDGFVPFFVDQCCVGAVRSGFAGILREYDNIFLMAGEALTLQPGLRSFDDRSEAFHELALALLDKGHLSYLINEPYAVTDSEREQALFVVDRVLASYLGVRCFGQHLNGYVERDGEIFLWIATRAKDRNIYPGCLDNLVAGGLPYGIGLDENLAKECYEEAGISAELASCSTAVSTITYNAVSEKGYKADTLYCYDLLLPEDFVPVCTDGEVESFELYSIDKVIEIIDKTTRFKPNCNLVVIDFLLRHGLVDNEQEDYRGLREALQVDFKYDIWTPAPAATETLNR